MSTVILVPGFWLDASSWDDVLPPLEHAGHRVVPITLPGLEAADADRTGIGLADHVAAVVAEVDRHDEPVVLVGHSGGGVVAWCALDARPDRVSRVVYVDSGPLPAGQAVNAALPADGDDVPLPDWDVFRADGSRDLDGLDDAALAAFRARAVPHPRGAAHDPVVLSDDDRRYAVPATLISTTFTRAEIDACLEQGVPHFAELPRHTALTIVELPTGHWPQLSRPVDLATVLLATL